MIKVLIVFLIFILVLWLSWRLLSKRYVIPCPSWLAWMVEMDNPFTKVNRAQNITQDLQLTSGMKVVDIGCGPGRLTIPVAKAVSVTGRVTALDIQSEMLSKVKAKAESEQISNIEYLQAKIGDNQLPKDHFDIALLVTVLGEIPNQEAAMREVYACLKPGGILSVTEIIFDPHFQRQSTVLKVAEKCCFKKKEVFGNCIAYTMHLVKS